MQNDFRMVNRRRGGQEAAYRSRLYHQSEEFKSITKHHANNNGEETAARRWCMCRAAGRIGLTVQYWM